MKVSALFGTLCIRADASPQIGIGHVMRCIALAQAWQVRGGRVALISHQLPGAVKQRCIEEQIDLHEVDIVKDVEQTAAVYEKAGASFLVLDGYHFTPQFRLQLKQRGLKLLVVDDLADADLSQADIILNHNAYASDAMYSGRMVLTGSHFTLLRREFLSQQSNRPAATEASTILITLGGSDPGNATQRVLQQLAGFTPRHLHLKIIVGAGNPHLESLRMALPAAHDCEIMVNPPNLPKLMSEADLAITAAGSTCWELACLGVPMLLVVIAGNQRGITSYLMEKCAARMLGDDLESFQALVFDAAARKQLAGNAHQLVDGRGAARVAERIACHPLALRRATLADARVLWEWANDAVTRQASFNSDPIPWETHLAWLQRRLADACSAFFMAEAGAEPVGTIRFDRQENGSAEISLSLAPAARGRGLGARLIRLGTFTVLDEGFCHDVRGWVKSTNTASIRAFQCAGWTEYSRAIQHGTESLEFRSQP